jgi:hypothetical protein
MFLKIVFVWLCTTFLISQSFAASAGIPSDLAMEAVKIGAASPYRQRPDGLAWNALDQLRHMRAALSQELRKPRASAVNRTLVITIANAIGELITTAGFTLGERRYEYGFGSTGPSIDELRLMTGGVDDHVCLGNGGPFASPGSPVDRHVATHNAFVAAVRDIHGPKDLEMEIALRCGNGDWRSKSPLGGSWKGRDRTRGDDIRREVMRQTEWAWTHGFVTGEGDICLPMGSVTPPILARLANVHYVNMSVPVATVTDFTAPPTDRVTSAYYPIGIPEQRWVAPAGGRTQFYVIVQDDAVVAANRLRIIVGGTHTTNPIAILNCANATEPGGGARGGAGAQEESLCLRSNLLIFLEKHRDKQGAYDSPPRSGKYGLNTSPDHKIDFKGPNEKQRITDCDGGIFTSDVEFFRDPPTQEGPQYDFIGPVTYAVITIAAVDKRTFVGDAAAYERMMKDKIRFQLRSALRHNVRAIVLAAFGCGVFAGDPDAVSLFYQQVLNEDEFRNQFTHVAFAIMAPTGHRNLEAFKERFGCIAAAPADGGPPVWRAAAVVR